MPIRSRGCVTSLHILNGFTVGNTAIEVKLFKASLVFLPLCYHLTEDEIIGLHRHFA